MQTKKLKYFSPKLTTHLSFQKRKEKKKKGGMRSAAYFEVFLIGSADAEDIFVGEQAQALEFADLGQQVQQQRVLLERHHHLRTVREQHQDRAHLCVVVNVTTR